MKNLLLAAIIMIASITILWAQEYPSGYEWPELTPYFNEQQNEQKDMGSYSREEMREWGLLQPIRFFSIDPLSHEYPSMTPYHYTSNNPIRFIDPTGMWVVDYDKDGNIVNAVAEDGDNLESLYSQLGQSAEDFAKQYSIDDISKFEVIGNETKFDITDFVFKNTNFSEDNTMMNCFSSCLAGSGAMSEEMPISGGFKFTESAQELFGFQKVDDANPGTMVTWVDPKGITHHSAIYALTSQDGTQYYVGRPGPNSNISVQTSKQNNQLYPNFQINYLIYPFTKPKF